MKKLAIRRGDQGGDLAHASKTLSVAVAHGVSIHCTIQCNREDRIATTKNIGM